MSIRTCSMVVPVLRVDPEPRRVTKVVRCFDKLSHHRQGVSRWVVARAGRVRGVYGAGMGPSLESLEAGPRSGKQEGSPSRPSTPATEPKLKQAQPFYWARLPALFFTPSPLLPELVPLFTSSTSQLPTSQTIHQPDHFLNSKNSLSRWVTQRPTSSPSTPFGSWP